MSKNEGFKIAKTSHSDLLKEEWITIDDAVSPLEKKQAYRLLSLKKKGILRQRAEEQLIKTAFVAPNVTKQIRSGSAHPLNINGVITFDKKLWEEEFRAAYGKLFIDPDNNVDTQQKRLETLREK